MHIDEAAKELLFVADNFTVSGLVIGIRTAEAIRTYLQAYDAANALLASRLEILNLQQAKIKELEKENDCLRERDEALQSLLLNNAGIRNAFERACNFSFQAPGMYDGAMSSDCKQQFEREHRILCLLLGRDSSNLCDAGGESQ